MSQNTNDNKVDGIDKKKRLSALKKKADLLGISYPNNISEGKLKEKVDKHISDAGGDTAENIESVGPDQSIRNAEAKARKPILAIVTDLDSQSQDEPTIVKNVSNAYFKVGAIIQKGVEQIIPSAIIDALKAQTMTRMEQTFHAITKRPTGNKQAVMTKRFKVDVIDENPEIEGYTEIS